MASKPKPIYVPHGTIIRGPFKTWAEANKAMVEGTGPWRPK